MKKFGKKGLGVLYGVLLFSFSTNVSKSAYVLNENKATPYNIPKLFLFNFFIYFTPVYFKEAA